MAAARLQLVSVTCTLPMCWWPANQPELREIGTDFSRRDVLPRGSAYRAAAFFAPSQRGHES